MMRKWIATLALALSMVGLGGVVGVTWAFSQPRQVDGLEACVTEDGNDWSGEPCVWTDPDTGDMYFNSGR